MVRALFVEEIEKVEVMFATGSGQGWRRLLGDSGGLLGLQGRAQRIQGGTGVVDRFSRLGVGISRVR